MSVFVEGISSSPAWGVREEGGGDLSALSRRLWPDVVCWSSGPVKEDKRLLDPDIPVRS